MSRDYDDITLVRDLEANRIPYGGYQHMVRWFFNWPDRTLNDDWRSSYEPHDWPDMRAIVYRYLKMRRRAAGWNPRRYDQNNHKAIPNADVLALVADARALDHGDRPSGENRRRGRPRKATGHDRECAVCRGRFRAQRSTARYCGAACRQKGLRDRQKIENVTLSRHENPRSEGLVTESPADALDAFLRVTERHG